MSSMDALAARACAPSPPPRVCDCVCVCVARSFSAFPHTPPPTADQQLSRASVATYTSHTRTPRLLSARSLALVRVPRPSFIHSASSGGAARAAEAPLAVACLRGWAAEREARAANPICYYFKIRLASDQRRVR